jgi:phospholipid transport system substrate-binding protein
MMKRFCFSSLLIAILSFSTVYAEDEKKPGMIVQHTVNQVLVILTDNDLTEDEKKTKGYDIVAEQIDFTGMSRRILAINWKKSSDEQKQKFESLFRQILLNTYWQRIKNYDGEKVEYITGMIDGNRFATVDTVIVSDKIEIPITYRMELIDGNWMAYDFLIESLSLVTSYRTEYRNMIKNHGVDGLLKKMQERLSSSDN